MELPLTLSKWVYDSSDVFAQWTRWMFGGMPLIPNGINLDPLPLEHLDPPRILNIENPFQPRRIVRDMYIPLHFWFNPGPDPDAIKRSYPKYDLIMVGLDNINDMCLDDLLAFEKEFYDFRSYYVSKMRGHLIGGLPAFQIDIDLINERKKELFMLSDKRAYSYYTDFVHTSELGKMVDSNSRGQGIKFEIIPKKIVCGSTTYELYPLEKPWCPYNDFLEILNDHCLSYQPSEEQFLEWLYENCCGTWGKIDRHGEFYAGFWNYPEESEERKNAFQLSHEDNYQALIELPYPRKLIMHTVEIGCSNHYESPRYSHFLCWWFDQTIKKFGFLDTLEKTTIYTLNCKHIPLPAIYCDQIPEESNMNSNNE